MSSFWQKVRKTETCWLWTAYTTVKGYGRVMFNSRVEAAHRVAYTLARGPIPHGMSVLHRCDVRNCVNPEHLFLGSQLENVRDMDAKLRRSPVRGERNPNSRIDEVTAKEIRASMLPLKVLAEKYGLSSSGVQKVRYGKTWQNV